MAEFEINVKYQTQPNIKVKVTSETTVAELKAKLGEEMKLPAGELKLIYKGKILKTADDKMSDLSIAAESTLHMIHNKPAGESQTATAQTGQATTTGSAPAQPAQQNAFPNPNLGFGGMGGMGGFGGFGGFPGMGGMGGTGGGMGGLGGMGGMGGLGGMDPAMMQQMMSNPQFQAMTQRLLSNPQMLRNLIQTNPQLQQMTQNIPGFDQMISDPNFMNQVMGQMGVPAQPQGTTPAQPSMPAPTQPTTTPAQPAPAQPTPTQPTGAPLFPPGLDLDSMMNNPMFQQYMQNMGSTGGNPFTAQPPQQPPANTNYEELYKDQLLHLKEMGFTNKEVNIDVLKQCYGNVEAAIERLLSMFK